VATYAFPEDAFVAHGDPEAIRESGRSYGRFAATAAEAAASLRGLGSGAWVGSEGDLFRARVAELPPHLDTAHGAFGQVAWALGGFADELDAARRQLATVRADAEQTFRSLAEAEEERAGLGAISDRATAGDADAHTAHEQRQRHLDVRIGRLRTVWADHLTAAADVRARLLEAARQAGATIRAAGRTSPTADQGWLADRWGDGTRWAADRLRDLQGFIAEHVAGFRLLAKALRAIGIALVAIGAVLAVLSLVAGLFSFGIGWLGEVPAGLTMQGGFLLWGAGDALDSTVDWAEGRTTGRHFLVDAGLAMALSLGGARLVKPMLAGVRGLVPKLQGWLRTRLLPFVRDQVLSRLTGPVRRAVEEWVEALRRQLPGESWTDPGGGWHLRVEGGTVLSLDPGAAAAADAFLDRARTAEPGLTNRMEDISSRVDQAELVGRDERLKTDHSLKRALATELHRRPFLDPAEILERRIQDSVRYTVQLPPDHGYAAGVAETVGQLRRRGAENVSWKWSWGGDGYKGINSSWRDPVSGQVFEVQFHTHDSFLAKTATHTLYEQERLPTTPPEVAGALAEEQAQIFRKVPIPPGVEDLIHRPD
jgi:hypothetical protein